MARRSPRFAAAFATTTPAPVREPLREAPVQGCPAPEQGQDPLATARRGERYAGGKHVFHDVPWGAFFTGTLAEGNRYTRVKYELHAKDADSGASIVEGYLSLREGGSANVVPTPSLVAWLRRDLIHVGDDSVSFQLIERLGTEERPGTEYLLVARYSRILGDRWLRIFRPEELPAEVLARFRGDTTQDA